MTILTGMTLAVLLIAAGIARCAEIKLAWNPNPAAENVTFYELKAEEVWGLHTVTAKTPNTTLTMENLKAGVHYFFSVRAENAAGVGDYSEAITGVPLRRYRVTLQVSNELGVWNDTEVTAIVPAKGAEFFRGKIEEVEP
jgi:hypothetical protein